MYYCWLYHRGGVYAATCEVAKKAVSLRKLQDEVILSINLVRIVLTNLLPKFSFKFIVMRSIVLKNPNCSKSFEN